MSCDLRVREVMIVFCGPNDDQLGRGDSVESSKCMGKCERIGNLVEVNTILFKSARCLVDHDLLVFGFEQKSC